MGPGAHRRVATAARASNLSAFTTGKGYSADADYSARVCVLLCPCHHQVVIHRWGWTLVLNPDGTTTAWNKDKTKVLHSHGPPVRPG